MWPTCSRTTATRDDFSCDDIKVCIDCAAPAVSIENGCPDRKGSRFVNTVRQLYTIYDRVRRAFGLSKILSESIRIQLVVCCYFFSFSRSRISVSRSSSFDGAGAGAGAASAAFFLISLFINLTIRKTQNARIVKSMHCWMNAP